MVGMTCSGSLMAVSPTNQTSWFNFSCSSLPTCTASRVLLHPSKCPPRNETVCVSYHNGEKRLLPHEDALQGQDHCESSRHDSLEAGGYPLRKTVPGECVNTTSCPLRPIRALNREWSSTHSPSPPCDADEAHLHSPDHLVTAVCEWWLPSPLLCVRY